jgi:hypothetical protein
MNGGEVWNGNYHGEVSTVMKGRERALARSVTRHELFRYIAAVGGRSTWSG